MIKGNNGKMTGFNAFILSNTWLATIGLPFTLDAPLAAIAPSQPTNVAVSFLAGTATVTWVKPDQAAAGSICRIWGRVEGIKGHVQLITTEAFDTLTKDITTIRGADGAPIPFTSLVGKFLHVQMDTVEILGTKSPGSNVPSALIA